MAGNRDTARRPARDWNPRLAGETRARIQSRIFCVVVWFGFCGMMLSGLVGTEAFLLQELSLRVVTTLSTALCALGICCAVGGSFTAIQLLLFRDKLCVDS